jgi:hypothetical protein
MKVNRRNVLMSTLFGAGYVGLRSLATGIPAAILMKGKDAIADGATCPAPTKAQYFILQTSGSGDPISANVPGTYATTGPLATISHAPTLPATPLTINGQASVAAQPWATVPAGGLMAQSVLDRTTFWHIMTNTPVHPREPDVLGLLGATAPNEMLPSLLSKQLAPCLGTVQSQPITLGATTPSEGLSFGGQALPIIPPLALKATLTNPGGPLAGLTNLQKIRDNTLAQLDDIWRGSATKSQKAYLDALVTSQSQIRSINQNLLNALNNIGDNSAQSQITAAIVLIQMNVTPVVAIHIPFGGDNHNDTALTNETTQTLSGVGAIAYLMSQLQSTQNANGSLIDQVSFISLNVFGRTLGPSNTDGRQHNPNHQVSLAIGKPFSGGIIGGVAPVQNDFGCLPINSQTGAGTTGGDIQTTDTLASFGKTVMTAVGIDSGFINANITSGKVVKAALA